MFQEELNINNSFMEKAMILDETLNNPDLYPPDMCPTLALMPLSNDYSCIEHGEGLSADFLPVLLFDDDDEDEEDDMSDDESFDDMDDDFDDDFDEEDDFDDEDEDYEEEEDDFDYEEDVDYDDFDE